MSVEYEIRKALLAKLRGDLAAMTPSVAVLDHPSQDQAFPYVTLDRAIGRNVDILADDYTSFLFYLTVWSQARGHREVQEICGTARSSLNRAALTPAKGRVVDCRVNRTDVVRDADGVTYMGSIEVEVLAEY